MDPSAGQAGPVNGGALVKMFAAGTLSGDTLAWNPDMSDWTPIANIPDLQPPKPKPKPLGSLGKTVLRISPPSFWL